MDTNLLLVVLSALTNHPPSPAGPSVNVPINWNTIITVLGGVALAWLQYRQTKKVDKVVEKVEAVAVTTDKTEKLVNSGSGIQKRLLLATTAALVEAKPSKENEQLLVDAQTAVKEHDANQGRADQVQAMADAKLKP
jgi:folate-binding Fe-S cluster repair protein YgfZ